MIEVEASTGVVGILANFVGCDEPALRLLISIFLGFPFALIHRWIFYDKTPFQQHIFFVVCGISLGCWNFGLTIFHSFFALCTTYLILVGLGGTSLSVIITFAFNMFYLLWGYWTTTTDGYDIKWTMPHCVLTLRLIGLSFNLFDGQKDPNKLSEYQNRVALKTLPSFLEVAAAVYFPGAFLIGPQFSMRRYLDYVNKNLIPSDSNGKHHLPDSIEAGIKRTIQGLIYIAIFQIGITYIPDEYLTDSAFDNESFFKRIFLLGLWGRLHLYKYISCWLVSEGVCTIFGISYNGKDKSGVTKWDGCKNVDLWTFENATQFQHYILAFNMNTNHWVAEYVYKRLKFLGSRHASQFFTLAFLAVWHGFHSGYYVCFFMEFIIMYFEKDIAPSLKANKTIQAIANSTLGSIAVWIILKIYTFIFMGYAFLSFGLLSYTRYVRVYTSIYWIGHIIFMSYPIVAPYIKSLLREKSVRETKKE